MTIEEAIKNRKRCLAYLEGCPSASVDPDGVEAVRMSIDALRAQQATADDAIEGLCCDCVHGGPCCDYSENEGCEYRRADGSCWIPHRPAKLDRRRRERCNVCTPKEMFCNGKRANYCQFCGRPLTEEAWAELERRIGGNDETD